MATKRNYAYYIKGSKLALIEKNVSTSDNALTEDTYGKYKSPASSITNGIQLEYTYSPQYRIVDIDAQKNIIKYNESAGMLTLTADENWGFNGELNNIYIVIPGNSVVAGIHKITNDCVLDPIAITNTVYNGGVVYTLDNNLFAYEDVEALVDENSTLDVSSYLAKALVNYVKARLLEDRLELDGKEYFMRQFRNMVEKYNSAKINPSGMYRIQGHGMQ